MMNEISLSYLFKLALKRIWIIILAAIILATGVFCYFNFAVSPIYKATGSILVTNGAITSQSDYSGSKISSTDISASLALSYTVTDILNTSDIFKQLSNKTGSKYTYAQLMSKCNIVRRNEDTLFIDISFTAPSREEAIELVNTYLSLAPAHIVKYLPDSNANIATGADKSVQTYPNTSFYTVIAAFIGAIIAFVIIFIVDSFDNTIKGEEYFTSHFDVPLLGSIPDFENYGIANYSKGGQENANK